MMISSCQRSKVKGQSIKVSKFLSRARLKRLLGLSVVCALGLGLVSVCLGGRLWLNPTASVPPGLYLLSKIDTDAGDAPLQTGDLVLACLPWEAAALGRERGYLLPGSCPGGSSPVGKYVAARAGSEITVEDNGPGFAPSGNGKGWDGTDAGAGHAAFVPSANGKGRDGTDAGAGYAAFAPSADDDREPHIALKNIRQRLEMMCGGTMTIRPRKEGGTVVTVTIP